MKHLLLILIPVLLFASCDDSKQKADEALRRKAVADSIANAEKDSIASLPQNRVGKYVYIDNYGVLHTSLYCRYINFVSSTDKEVTDDDGNLVDESTDVRRGSGIRRVLLNDMNLSMLKDACHRCINDEMYDYLRNRISSDAPHGCKKSLGINWVM